MSPRRTSWTLSPTAYPWTIVNFADRSSSVAPELLDTGVTNLELRCCVFWLRSARLSNFGEKQNDRHIELRVRYDC